MKVLLCISEWVMHDICMYTNEYCLTIQYWSRILFHAQMCLFRTLDYWLVVDYDHACYVRGCVYPYVIVGVPGPEGPQGHKGDIGPNRKLGSNYDIWIQFK